MDKYAVIVAGGKGSRMGTSIAKQYLLLNTLPILIHTIQKFFNSDSSIKIILVIPESDFDYWNALCIKYSFKISHQLVAGGTSRFQSVKNGLAFVKNNSLVAIHDGVRPLIDEKIIIDAYSQAEKKGSAITSIPLKDSIREIVGKNSESRERSKFQIIQTPQTFQSSLIKVAYDTDEQAAFTDDSSVAEHAGNSIHLIEGSYRNIKITTEEDMFIANAYLNQ
jgi:2-C-methyl-D-erythritol 4-phosphate cytidylyltransferase